MIRSTLTTIGAALLLLAPGCAPSEDDPSVAGSSGALAKVIDVKPMAVFGSGSPGDAEDDIDEPDGIVFDKAGNVVMTDGANHRVQVWNPRTNKRLGEFGTPEIFQGNIVDLAFSPVTGQLIVTDESSHMSYGFDPPSKAEKGDAAFTNYKFTGNMFAANGLQKVGGITFDSKGRIYLVDARKNLVSRFDAEGNVDPTWKFAEKGSTKFLNGCEGVAVDEKRGNLYVASEFHSVIRVFDLNDGSYKNQMIGRRNDAAKTGEPTGPSVFSAAVEGLWILDDYLLASDEGDGGTGHLAIFDLADPTVFDHAADDYEKLRSEKKPSGFIGLFGNYASPDSVTAYTDENGESYVAIADQNHYQVPVYKWSDIRKAGKFDRKK